MPRRKTGRMWVISGSVWKGNRRMRHVEKSTLISCEADLDEAETKLRDDLHRKVMKYKSGTKDVRIEVESDIQ